MQLSVDIHCPRLKLRIKRQIWQSNDNSTLSPKNKVSFQQMLVNAKSKITDQQTYILRKLINGCTMDVLDFQLKFIKYSLAL